MALGLILALAATLGTAPGISPAAAADEPAVSLSHLTVEKKVEPIGIDLPQPRFAWVISSTARDVVQESYQLTVSSPDAVVWDSGLVASDDSIEVAYDGPALQSDTRYTWDVSVVTNAGSASASSWFRTGLVDDAAWEGARWIGNARPGSASDLEIALNGATWIRPALVGGNTPSGYMRTTFTTDTTKTVDVAEIVMTADASFAAYLNGTQVASRPMVTNGWRTAARAAIQPISGSNVLAVRMNNEPDDPTGALIGKVVIRYTDGSTQTISTDNTWLVSVNATTGWHLAGYDASSWAAATAVGAYGTSPWGTQVSVPATTNQDTRMTFDTASWVIPPIGVPNASTNPVPSALYRGKVTASTTKAIAWAQLAVTSDQIFNAYWNGTLVADGQGTNNEWRTADIVNLTASPGDNQLAIATTAPVPSQYGGILARVRIGYVDGTTSEWISDGNTRTLITAESSAPSGWTRTAFDDSSWSAGQAQALYRGWVYADRVTIPELDPTGNDLWLTGASWIWTDESGNPPAGNRAFRRVVNAPAGRTARSAQVVITGDDLFRLWIDGRMIGQTDGSENQWRQSRRYNVNLTDQSSTLIALGGTNTNDSTGNSPAGIVAAIRITYSDNSTQTIVTNSSFRATKTVPEDYADPDLDDSSWVAATERASFGSGPWANNVARPVEAPAPAPLLRRDFTAPANIANATLHFTAGGYADFRLNGAPVSDELLAPGFTDYDDTVQYRSVDVTSQLNSGTNAISAELGRGFYSMTGANVWRWQSPSWRDEPKVRAVLSITQTNGTKQHIVTDDTWTIHDGPTRFDDLYAGEVYDASYEIPGYDEPGFDDSSWLDASIVRAPLGELVNQRQQPIRITEEFDAVSMTEPVDGIYVIKFPKMLAGNVRVTAEGSAGTTITMKHAEKLLPSGLLNMSNNGGFAAGFQTDSFVLAGTGGPETWQPRFSYKGFQYIEVSGWPGGAPPLSAFTALAVNTDAELTGSFDSSEPIMNSVHDAVVRTLYNNLHGIPTDTPMFEKNGWTGDAALGAEMFLMNMDTTELFAKWIRDVDESRRPDGAPMVIAPSSTNWGDWGTVPTWHSAYIMIPWWLYQYSGDREVLDTYYANMKQYIDLEYGRAPGGIAETRLGDWVAPEASPAGGNPPEDRRISGTAFLYEMLRTMERIAELRGLDSDAATFASRADTVKDAFNNLFFDATNGYYRGNGDNGYRQTHNVLALAFDMAPDAQSAQRVADSIAADVLAKGTHLNTGILGTKYLLPVLTDHGYADLAYALAVQTTYPSWGYKIANGGTSMWEHWSLESRSLGHYFLGTVDDWHYHYVLGLKPDLINGWRDFAIAPAVTEHMESATGSLRTPYGQVASDWTRTASSLQLNVTVPVGTTATVRVPSKMVESIRESGAALADADGVHSVTAHDNWVDVVVGSGSYSFTVDDRIEQLSAVASATAALGIAIDEELSGQPAADGQALVSDINDVIAGSAADLISDDAVAAAQRLVTILDLQTALEALDGADGPVSEAVAALIEAVHATVNALLGISVSIFPSAGTSSPGDRTAAEVRLSNTGTATVGSADLTAISTRDGVALQVTQARMTTSLAPGAEAVSRVQVTTSPSALPGDYPLQANVSYAFAGHTVLATAHAAWHVTTAAQISSVSASPATAEPGGSVTLTVTLDNPGAVGVSGLVEVSGPDGWQPSLPSVPVHVPAGQSTSIDVPVDVPWDAPSLNTATDLDVKFIAETTTITESTAQVNVQLPAVSAPLDHVDLGNSSSETAHALTASASSGTNTEAGLTRRYAGHQVDFSWFEFSMAVTPGEPFLLRSIETYDRSQTKRYKIYVDGEEVQLRQFPHTTGAGTETWQALIGGEFADSSGEVRVRYETQNDHSFYDPSIADVWTLPVGPDTVAPQVTVATSPQLPERASGWYRSSEVTASLIGRDDRGGDVTLEGGTAGTLSGYTDAYVLRGEGSHTVTYRASDEAGNQTETKSFGLRIDSVAPVTSAQVVGRTDQGTANVKLTATDATSGVAETWYRVNAGDWIQGTAIELAGAGNHTIQYRSVDVAGNVANIAATTVTITGQIPPTWNLGANPPGVIAAGATLSASLTLSPAKPAKNATWFKKKVWVSMRGTAPTGTRAVLQYRVDNGPWTTYRVPIAVQRNGSTRVQARTITMTQASPVVSRAINVDRVKPKKVKRVKKIVRKGKKRVIRFKAKDAHSGVARIRYKTRGKPWRVLKTKKKINKGIKITRAKQVIRVRAIDKAGNKSKIVKLKIKRAKR